MGGLKRQTYITEIKLFQKMQNCPLLKVVKVRDTTCAVVTYGLEDR